ncbi:MAG: hypothetical protein LBU83_11665 [Bacteroidales bacterium]|nr:hypothetical protein [Bacteroidales bacterium]
MRGVDVLGQPTYSYASFYRDRRGIGVLSGIFGIFERGQTTYLVAGSRGETVRSIHDHNTPAKPMNVYRGGVKIGSKFQSGPNKPLQIINDQMAPVDNVRVFGVSY